MTELQFRQFWQDRCEKYDPGCINCRAWEMRDLLAGVVRDVEEVAIGSPLPAVEKARQFLRVPEPVTWPEPEYNPWGDPEEVK